MPDIENNDDDMESDDEFLRAFYAPPDDWWFATPGDAIAEGYTKFEYGIGWYNLDGREQPSDSGLDTSQWAALREARALGMEIAKVVRELLVRGQRPPIEIALGLERYLDRALRPGVDPALRALIREFVPADGEACDSLAHPSAPQYLLIATILWELFRLLPGIEMEVLRGPELMSSEADQQLVLTHVETDRMLLRKVEVLLRHVRTSAGERTSSYLAAVSRCYLLGLVPEMAVMARAVMESALEERIEEESVRARVGPDRGRVGLGQYIEYAFAEGIFDHATREAAKRLKSKGDDAIHSAPGLEGSGEGILDDLHRVLDALDRQSGSSP
jgi:hypothetical protein